MDEVRVPVTLIKLLPHTITQVKNENGKASLQIGTGYKKTSKHTKPLQGHLKKIEKENTLPRYLFEEKTDETHEVGETFAIGDLFTVGDVVTVTAVSKGKGFAGGVKRWNFRGGPKTHGQSDRHRAPGSIGQGTTPGRVRKGKKMAGRMGGDTVTLKNIKVIGVDTENQTIKLFGPIPGSPKSVIKIAITSKHEN